MLKRGGKHVRIARDVEADRGNIQDMLFRFDNFYVNIQSQSGELNEEGGVMGYLHRLNSTLTWHNEAAAYMSMMKILRDQMVEELDLISDMADGCGKVRARYSEKYGESPLKDPKAKKMVAGYMKKGNLSQDTINQSFVTGLTPVMAKAKYRIQIEKLKRENPAVKDTVDEIFEDLGELGTLFE